MYSGGFVKDERLPSPCLRARHDAQGNQTVETVLQQFQDEAKTYPARHSQLAAVRYYLHHMLWECEYQWRVLAKGVTNYKSLLDMIEEWRVRRNESVCLVTFNYDTLLEDALREGIGEAVGGLTDYIREGRRYAVIKLNGSVNWARTIASGIELTTPRETDDLVLQVSRHCAKHFKAVVDS